MVFPGEMTSTNSMAFVKWIAYWLLYFGLAATSFLFVKQTMHDFFKGETYFTMRTEPLTSLDTPTFTFCWYPERGKWNMDFGKHFNIGFSSNERMIPPLVEGAWTKTHGDQLVLLTKMKTWGERLCYKINLPGERNQELVTGYYGEIKFDAQTPAPQESTLFVTTEENAYGVVFRRWYDGEVFPFVMKNQTKHAVAIPKVREYHYQPELCQNTQTYYQCLASKWKEINHNCTPKGCSPYTLPTATQFRVTDICDKEGDCHIGQESADFYVETIHFDETVCKNEADKLCIVKEYIVEDENVDELDETQNGYSIFLALLPPASSRGPRVTNPYKEVYVETFKLDIYQLIGTIGGTLGLMISFSFMGTITSITERVVSLVSTCRWRLQIQKKSKLPLSKQLH